MTPRVNGARVAARCAATPWWRAANTIPDANVLEHVENPGARQAYAGASATSAWTVAFRTNLTSITNNLIAFDAETGRLVIGTGAGGENGFFYAGAWANIALFDPGDHTYMIISSGSNVQAYKDGAAVSTPRASTIDIGGVCRWRSRYVDNAGAWLEWPVAIPRGMVANIALDATQRAALHTSLMA